MLARDWLNTYYLEDTGLFRVSLESGRTHEERPSLLVELKLDVPGKWRAVELRLAAEYLNVQHLAILRRYLDVCESVMQEAGASHE